MNLNMYGNLFTSNSLKDMFPQVFKEERKELVVGKWYKRKDFGKFMFCFNGNYSQMSQYGFCKLGNWSTELGIYNDEDYVEATSQEVEEAIKAECVKRNLTPENIAFIDCLCGFNKEDTQEFYKNNSEIKFYFESYVSKLWIKGASFLDVCVFDNGVFASIIPTLTIQQAEEKLKELGVNVKIV